MSTDEEQPIIGRQTTAQNEAVETVLGRLEAKEIIIPSYQRDSDEWDDVKKSLFVESILNRLTVPAFYLAPCEDDPDRFEVIDGQQRLTTLLDFFKKSYKLLDDERCPYYGNSVHYANTRYQDLHETWQRAFRRYNLTLVTLPEGMPLDLRLEIFRRINEGGTPLSAQDIRLSYYSESSAVRFIQLAGIYEPTRPGAERMIDNCKGEFDWPWRNTPEIASRWRRWWANTKTATGQTPSEMFLWFLVSTCHRGVDRILDNRTHITTKLNLSFRNRTDEVLDIVCAELRYEDRSSVSPRLLPNVNELDARYFPIFRNWWNRIRANCVSQVQVGKYRAVALLIPALEQHLGESEVTDSQWGWIGKFVSDTRKTANELGAPFPESKGRWTGQRGQRSQLDAYYQIAEEISQR